MVKFFIALYLYFFSMNVFSSDTKNLQEYLSKNKIGESPDYAFVKNGIAGPDHLITIHGYADDRAVCEALAREYNGDESLSDLPGKYRCIQLNE